MMLDALAILEEGEALVHRDPTTIDSGDLERPKGLRLRIVTGQESFDIPLAPGTYVLGRGRDADIRIDRPGISRAHIRLTVGEHVILEDLGSANGTRVAGRRLGSRTRILLAPGLPVEFGDAVALLDCEEAPVAPETGGDRVLRRIASTELPVLVSGEAGSGKGYAARRIHSESLRARGPFVAIDCPGLRFTRVDPTAAFAAAREGTLLLDSVTDLDPLAQAEIFDLLWRVEKLDAPRILATCSADIQQLVASGAFRADLYHRLAQLTLVVPPLRARLDELPSICAGLLAEIAFEASIAPPLLSSDALRVLERHAWPGNIRELRGALAGALVGGGRVLTATHFRHLGAKDVVAPSPPAPNRVLAEPVSRQRSLRDATEEAEHAQILDALRLCSGNQTRAAKILGISRGTLIARLDRYGIPRPRRPV